MKAYITPEAIQTLSAIPSFAELDATLLDAIAQAAIQQDYAPGQIVFLEGEACAGLYIVRSGWLKGVKISPTGREQIIRFMGPGEVFNETSTLVGCPNLTTIVALEPVRLWLIRRDDLLHLMDTNLSLSHAVTQNLAQHVLRLMRLVEDLSMRTVEARLARLLLEHTADWALLRHQWTTRTEMAALIGTVPDVLNRAIRALVEEGLIQMERHQVQILDRYGLETKAMLG